MREKIIDKLKGLLKGYYNSLIIPVITFLYYEIMFKLLQGGHNFRFDILDITIALLFSLVIGIINYIFHKKARVIFLVFMILIAILYMTESYLCKMFTTYFSLINIISMAGNVATNYTGDAFALIFKNIYILLIFILPIVFYIVFWKKIKFSKFRCKSDAIILLLVMIILFLSSSLLIVTKYSKALKEHSFNGTVLKYGLNTGLLFDVMSSGVENEYVIMETTNEKTEDVKETEEKDADEKDVNEVNITKNIPITYNELKIDFDSINEKNPKNDVLKKVNNYIKNLKGSKKNKYTGMLKGKNLIMICAESFCGYAVTKEMTPTVYSLLNNGFVFKDYYNALSNISTTNGEFQFLFSLNPSYGVNSMKNIVGHNNYFTMASQMKRIGYETACFHNGDFYYYNRDLSHECLGYDYYMALGNGLEKRTNNSRLDFDLFDKTLDLYLDKDKFSVYYMTYDCHLPYLTYDDLYKKYSDIVKQYVEPDAQFEKVDYLSKLIGFDRAIENLIKKLKDAGKLDDTVICITSDHYPYALMDAGGTAISELYGFKFTETDFNLRDKNMAVIWSPQIEKLKLSEREIKEPTSNKDLLPTLSNLFGLDFDSRFMTGRDIFSDEEPLVYWDNHSFLTKDYYYDALNEKIIPNNNEVKINDEEVHRFKNLVSNKIGFSKDVLAIDYYNYIFDNNSENSNNESDSEINVETNNAKYVDIVSFADHIDEVKTLKDYDLKNIKLDQLETVNFGHFEQDGDLENGLEPIEWIVVDKFSNGALLLSKKILGAKRYSTISNGNMWENSELRKFLNNDFLNTAFGKSEKSIIMSVNHYNNEFLYDQEDTVNGDKVFIFSNDDYVKYFGVRKDSLENKILSTRGTVAARNAGLFKKDNTGEWYDGNSVYWLRDSVPTIQNYVCTVEYNGFMSAYGNVCTYDKYGYRPAIWIDWHHEISKLK